MTLNEFLGRLEKVRKTGQNQYVACCPGHDDKNPSLCITSNAGKILLHCHRGCDTSAILAAMGLEMRDLFTQPPKGERCGTRVMAVRSNGQKSVRYHVYRGENGESIARKSIHTNTDGSKYAIWERYTEGGFIKGLGAAKVPLYRLPELIASSGRVYVVEGEKDCETMARLGLTATTSPKGASGKWSSFYTAPLEGREVVIISDNDEAGQSYARNAIKALSGVAVSVKHIPAKQLYPHLKEKGDISDIADILGKERTLAVLEEELKKTLPEHIDEMPSYFYYNKNGQLCVDRTKLASHIRANERYLFEAGQDDHAGRRLWYKHGVYQSVSTDEIRSIIKGYITSYSEAALSMSDVEEVLRNITTDPVFVSADELDCDENIINFKNGILYLDTLELKPHTPDIYTSIQIDCEWCGEPSPTPVFDAFLTQLCSSDSGKMRFLTEFMGMALSNVKGYRMKSALFMVGEGNTGKSQLKSLCERILGVRNCAAIDLDTLERRFGTSAICGKRLSGSSDLSYMSVNELKIFKQVTGGDRIFAERKGHAPFYYTYNGLLWFCMNRLPKFGGDRGDWVYDRINIIECNNIIPPERRDKLLCEKMYAERKGIVHRCVSALIDVIKRGYTYTSTPELTAKRMGYSKMNNPVASFYELCCEDDEKNSKCLTVTAMHRVFMRWCKDNESGFKCSLNEFKDEMARLHKKPYEAITQRTKKGVHFTFSLTAEAMQAYYVEKNELAG